MSVKKRREEEGKKNALCTMLTTWLLPRTAPPYHQLGLAAKTSHVGDMLLTPGNNTSLPSKGEERESSECQDRKVWRQESFSMGGGSPSSSFRDKKHRLSWKEYTH